MNIQSYNNSVSFKKILSANAGVINDGKTYPCKIYKLEKSDTDYFEKFADKEGWSNLTYIDEVYSDFIEYADDESNSYAGDFFVIEDSDENCLGYMETFDLIEDKAKNVDFIEVVKDASSRNKNRTIRYVGETLLAFLGKLIKKENYKNQLLIEVPVQSAYKFYTEKCGFKEGEKFEHFTFPELYLPPKSIEALISQNEQHTRGEIELIG